MAASIRAGLRLRDTGEAAPDRVRAADETTTAVPQRRHLYCVHCRARVTDSGARVQRLGRHAHVFANPDGIVFRIGCFAQAPGCREVGAATARWSWFPGFHWRVAVCVGCGAHLGWHYSGAAGERFYGLILAHLVEGSESP